MLETSFQRSFAIRRLRQGPLAEYVDPLADRLAAQGYSRVQSRIQLRHIGHFNRWLQQEHLSLEQLDENIIGRYWRSYMREKRVRPKDVFALMKLLDLLREQGVTPRRTIGPAPTPRDTLLEKYRCYLREERGLAPGTIRIVLPFVDRFLAQRFPRHCFDFAALDAKDITTFVRKQATELGSVQTKHMVTALRGFCRYLRHCGDVETDLAGCVPRVPYYAFSTVPRFLPTG